MRRCGHAAAKSQWRDHAMTFWKWSRTASANATADSTCPFPEGMAPSAVNDGVRGAMAAVAKYRDDIAGAITTGGTSTAYTVSSYQVFDSLTHMDGAMIAFTPHAGNGGTVTLNVDGLGAKPLRLSPGVELPSNTLVLGTPYVATYFNTAGEWILQGGVFANPFAIPLGGGIDFWGATTPNSAFAFPAGQALSRTTYAPLFTMLGTSYGAGDGSTTFNLPDKTGRASFMKEATATRLTTAGGGIDGATMGSAAGSQTKALITANLPAYTPAGSVPSVTVNSSNTSVLSGTPTSWANGGGSPFSAFNSGQIASGQITSTGSGTFSGTAQGGTSTPVAIVPPGIVCNYIMRII
jgi:microcystin-dependent protein